MPTEAYDIKDKIVLIAGVNIAVALAVVVLKYVAYAVSGSVALFSDALESIVNVMTAVAALIAIRLSAKPADSDHPFGHHKAEFLAAMFEGAMIAVAAVLILIKAYAGLVRGVKLEHSGPRPRVQRRCHGRQRRLGLDADQPRACLGALPHSLPTASIW